MNIFPTQYSTLSSIALNGYVEENYGLNNMTCRLLIRNVSDTYILENENTKYIFKIYRNSHRTIDEIKGEVELLNILKERGAKVSYPIRDMKGGQIQQFHAAEGIRNGVLFSFAPGKVIWDLNDQQLRTLGKEVALIHNISSSINLEYHRQVYDFDTTLASPLKSIKPAFTYMPEEYTYLLKTAGKVIDKMKQYDTSRFGYGYCHYDLIPKNFHFDERGQITFFDFDFAGKGYLSNDLMSFFAHFFFHVHFNKITQEKANKDFEIFIDAYREVRPLSDTEIEAIPYLGVMFWIFYLEVYVKNFDDWSNTFLTPQFLRDRVDLIKKWTEWYCKF